MSRRQLHAVSTSGVRRGNNAVGILPSDDHVDNERIVHFILFIKTTMNRDTRATNNENPGTFGVGVGVGVGVDVGGGVLVAVAVGVTVGAATHPHFAV